MLRITQWTLGILAFVFVSAGAPADEPDCSRHLVNSDAKGRVSTSVLYELEIGRHLQSWLQPLGEKVVILSEVSGWTLPAFDGVILGADNRKIANLSIKGVRVSDPADAFAVQPHLVPEEILKLIDKGSRAVQLWSEADGWDRWFKYSREEMKAILSQNQVPTIEARKELLDFVISLFSIPLSQTHVRTRMVIAVSDMDGQLQEIEDWQVPGIEIQDSLKNFAAYIESIVILSKSQVWTFTSPAPSS